MSEDKERLTIESPQLAAEAEPHVVIGPDNKPRIVKHLLADEPVNPTKREPLA